ncbi:hypothetical protein L1987_06216 [Smallanthus sonchifolius]|uniref:Uncharacterized protein n=1 Tax=Smallanthus sonchifolius TaxID=185202 RepID=A0ACB9JXI1_9ASTR|nr:hypothetical protein L1987_06216 [Smallanthus sonchifolius]
MQASQDLQALAPGSPSLVPVESPLGSEQDESDELHMERHHHSSDKSVAGGGVIIGGLVTVTFAAVYCYIRSTNLKQNHKAIMLHAAPIDVQFRKA